MIDFELIRIWLWKTQVLDVLKQKRTIPLDHLQEVIDAMGNLFYLETQLKM